MKRSLVLILLPLSLGLSQTLRDYPIRTVPFTNVTISDAFWAPRLDTNRTATIPHILGQCEVTGRVDNFLHAAGVKDGHFQGWWFNDSDVYKSIEAAAYELALFPDPTLEARVDSLVEIIAAAQEEDGYLFTPRRTAAPNYTFARYIGSTRWDSVQSSHELYVLGHLYESAVAYHEATGKRRLLDVAEKSAGLLLKVFGHGKSHLVPGHQEVEIGLVKLYRATGNEAYARLAKFFLDERGNAEGHRLYGEYSQDHARVADQTESVGHAVRALYMNAGMADMVALFGDSAYAKALDRLWEDVVGTKTYLTGGIGAAGGHEGFAGAYELPNLTAYCETCAAVASVLWNERMFRLYGDAKYFDVIEQTLYNGVLAGVGIDGRSFFYDNPLASDGNVQRSAWFSVACCPPNVARLLPHVAGMTYAHDKDRLFVNLFIQGKTTVPLRRSNVTIEQKTDYPWKGSVRIEVRPDQQNTEFSLLVRIPGWSRDEAFPLGLYRFSELSTERPIVIVNNERVDMRLNRGYAEVRRKWRAGDVVDVAFPLAVRRVASRDEVRENVGKIALQRGPIVYCVESADVQDGRVTNLVLRDDAKLGVVWRNDLPSAAHAIELTSVGLYAEPSGSVREQPVTGRAIPYALWAHRGKGEMSVWLSRVASAARPVPVPTIASKAKALSSGGDASAMNDQREPKSSTDRTFRYLHWWPRKGTQEWVEYAFSEPTVVSSVAVYWYDDTGIGECRVPRSYSVLYRAGDAWKPVEGSSGLGAEKNTYNVTTFKPVTTPGLRIEVQLPDSFSAGVHEWRVE